MTKLRNLTRLAAFGLLSVGLAAGASGGSDSSMAPKDIVETAVSARSFNTLVAAVKAAGLVDTLRGEGPFTVFAPTDAAFVKTLEVADEAEAIEAVNSLPIDALTNILLYHVTPGRRISTSVLAAPQYHMLNGSHLSRADLAAAGIAATDISASNGVIHVINSVLLP